MDFASELVRLGNELDFIIFEDRKFADIGKFTPNWYDPNLAISILLLEMFPL